MFVQGCDNVNARTNLNPLHVCVYRCLVVSILLLSLYQTKTNIMKTLISAVIIIFTLSSCSKNLIEAKDMNVTVEKQDATGANNVLLAINAEFTPKTFGENIQPFTLDVIITATPIIDLTSEATWLTSVHLVTLTETKSITSDEFIACRGQMVYGRGYQFSPNIPRAEQYLYHFTHEIQVRK